MPRGEQVQGNQMEVRRLNPRQGNTLIGLDLGPKAPVRKVFGSHGNVCGL